MTQETKEIRFAFGKNWASFSKEIDDEKVNQAIKRLAALISPLSLTGKRFLDIGCGSGLHSLAALELGAASVTAFDLDPDSVSTAQAVLGARGDDKPYSVRIRSVLDATPAEDGLFDMVYSWGVLHHTGQMHEAITRAAALVAPDGHLVIALYGKTRYCGVWTRIKRWYVQADDASKAWAERLYIRLFGAYLLLRGKTLKQHIAKYQNKRGMDFYHDVRDWIGGYPYESIAPGPLKAFLAEQGFECVKAIAKRRSGLFGSGCDEYVFRRVPTSPSVPQ